MAHFNYGGGGGGGTTPPGGSNEQVQYNDSGAFGGSSNLTFDGSTLNVTGAVETSGNVKAGSALYTPEFLYHTSDTDTKLQFTVDQINLIAGNVNFLKLKETTQNECVFFEGGDDVDFRLEAGRCVFYVC